MVKERANPQCNWGSSGLAALVKTGATRCLLCLPADEVAGQRSRGQRGALVWLFRRRTVDERETWMAQLAPDVAQEIRNA
eukprot:1339846-Pyramimonas_sp.AAC.2